VTWLNWFRRKRVREDLEAARLSRMAAETQWAREQVEIVRPLAQMRRENHIGLLADSLIRKRRGSDPDTASD
jgi:hypothetical protein